MTTAPSSMFHIEKLAGRENYATWKFAVKTYLEHEDLWQCVQPATDTSTVDPVKDIKARTKIILLLDPVNYVHVQDAKTARAAWENLEKAFDDNGLTRKVGLLKDLVTTSLENCNSIEEYVNKIMSTAHKLRGIGFNVEDQWIGVLMLAGLPDMYKPMIMGLESSGIQITADAIKTKLIQEVKSENPSAFYTKKREKPQKTPTKSAQSSGPRCFNCNQHGHIAKYCKAPKKPRENKENNSGFVAAFSAFTKCSDDQWYLDSGAAMHMTKRSDWLYDVQKAPVSNITVANNAPMSVESAGKVNITVNGSDKIQVRDVLYVPSIAVNLLSVAAMSKKGCKLVFNNQSCDIYNAQGKHLCSATMINNLYRLDVDANISANIISIGITDECILWHRRMGHLNFADIQKLPQCTEGLSLPVSNEKANITCETCLRGKHARLPFPKEGSRATQPLEIVHSDLCGPMETQSWGGKKYFITFIDDYTRKVFVYFLPNKTDILDIFKDFKQKVENELNYKIKCIRTDRGTEYCNKMFDRYLNKCGIVHQTTAPFTAQQNGLAERMNRTLVERARCMIFDANLTKSYWAEAVATAAYIINRSPTQSLGGKTPYETWSGRKPNLSHLRIFGCEAMAHIPKEQRRKWDAKSRKVLFTGYCDHSKAYRLMDYQTHRVIISRDVTFLEKKQETGVNVPTEVSGQQTSSELRDSGFSTLRTTLSLSPESRRGSSIPVIPPTTPTTGVADEENTNSEYDTGDSEIDTPNTSLLPDSQARVTLRSHQQRQQSQNVDRPPISPNSQENVTLRSRAKKNLSEEFDDPASYLCYTNLSDPQTVEEALSSQNSEHWKKAMEEEYDSLVGNQTWTLTERPSETRVIPCKWVFKTKTDQKGNIERYKARLVIKGCIQKKGLEYDEVYSPVVRYTSMRYLLALAVKYDLEIDQMDAVSAFLQGDIDRVIYMEQPPTYEKGSQVCKLHKSIYGLRQASRLWNMKLDSVLQEIGLKRSQVDPCVYYNKKQMIFIAVWVDDLIILTSKRETTNIIKEKLKVNFNMKDLGELKQCVGLNITRNRSTGELFIDQEKYIKEVLERFGMSECKPAKTPIEVGLKFEMKTERATVNFPYQHAIGCLIYLAHATRPDIAFVVNMLSRYNNNPHPEHWLAVKRVFRYLQGTRGLKLRYNQDGTQNITAYCDADWGGDIETRRSCSGYIFMFQGGGISWSSRRQQTTALSTTEAEYMSMSAAVQESLWFRQLQIELGQQDTGDIISIYCDNQSAIRLSLSDSSKPRTKHIDIRFHFIRDCVRKLYVEFIFVRSALMVADILTKGTSIEKHMYCTFNMGLVSV